MKNYFISVLSFSIRGKYFHANFGKSFYFQVLNFYVCGNNFTFKKKHWRILLIQLHFTFADPTSETPQLWNFLKFWKLKKKKILKFFFFWTFFCLTFTLLLYSCATPDYFQCPLSRIIKITIAISMIWSCTRKIIICLYTPVSTNQSINS